MSVEAHDPREAHRVVRSTQGNGVVTSFQYRGDDETSLPGAEDFTFDDCVKTNINDLSITTVHRDRNQRIIRDATAISTASTPPIRIKAIGRNRLGDLTLCTTRLCSAPGTPLESPRVEQQFGQDHPHHQCRRSSRRAFRL